MTIFTKDSIIARTATNNVHTIAAADDIITTQSGYHIVAAHAVNDIRTTGSFDKVMVFGAEDGWHFAVAQLIVKGNCAKYRNIQLVEHLTAQGKCTCCVIAGIIVINRPTVRSPAAVKLIDSAYAIKRIIAMIAAQASLPGPP